MIDVCGGDDQRRLEDVMRFDIGWNWNVNVLVCLFVCLFVGFPAAGFQDAGIGGALDEFASAEAAGFDEILQLQLPVRHAGRFHEAGTLDGAHPWADPDWPLLLLIEFMGSGLRN